MTNQEDKTEAELICDNIIREYKEARLKHKKMNSMHEGYAVILEELDEAWEQIKKDNKIKTRGEIYQVAAMCLAFLIEAC
jgi:hypothetical protein